MLVNQREKIHKKVFRELANKETEQKKIKTYKVFPDSYKLKIKNILRTEENEVVNQELENEEMENYRKRYLKNEQKV